MYALTHKCKPHICQQGACSAECHLVQSRCSSSLISLIPEDLCLDSKSSLFQNIKDEFHDDGALTELAGPSMDHRHQSAVQIIHVLRGKGLAIAPCLIANLHHREKGMTGYWIEKIFPDG